ncbi:hypothetical protein NMG60_11014632 [Bertholletia excelsa]
MTPQEERLVLELHSRWGNRWSRIARKLPGRTDNEIKNYWRTHMRKKAQEKKRAISPPSSSSKSSSLASNNPQVDSVPITENKDRSFYDTGGVFALSSSISRSSSSSWNKFPVHGTKEESFCDVGGLQTHQEIEKGYSMDDIWREIARSENSTEINSTKAACGGYSEEGCNFSCHLMASPAWNYCPDMLWMMEEEESKMIHAIADQFFPLYDLESSILTG